MPDFKSIEDIDKALEEEYEEMIKDDEIKDEEDNKPSDDNLTDDEVINDDDEEIIKDDEDEVEPEVESTDEDEDDVELETKVTKQEFAFKRLRQEKLDAEAKAKEYNDMAISLGYKDGAALLAAHKAKRVADEAKAKGVDPEFYKEFNDVKEELATTRKAKTEAEKQVKVDRFISALDEVAIANSLTAVEKQGIINQLAEDGYTMDDIITIKTPKKLIRGYLADRIVKSKVQEKIEKKKEKANLQEEKIKSAIVKEGDWKDGIAEEMKAYAKENNLHFED